IERHTRVWRNDSKISGPRTPSGFSRDWLGPAAKPSREMAKLLTRTLDTARTLFGSHGRPRPAADHVHGIANLAARERETDGLGDVGGDPALRVHGLPAQMR